MFSIFTVINPLSITSAALNCNRHKKSMSAKTPCKNDDGTRVLRRKLHPQYHNNCLKGR